MVRKRFQDLPISPQYVPAEVLEWAVQCTSTASEVHNRHSTGHCSPDNGLMQPNRQEMEMYLTEVSRKMVEMPPAGRFSVPTQRNNQNPSPTAYEAPLPRKSFPEADDELLQAEQNLSVPDAPATFGGQCSCCRKQNTQRTTETPAEQNTSPSRQQFYNPCFTDTSPSPIEPKPNEAFLTLPQQVLRVPGGTEFSPCYMQSVPARISNACGEVPLYGFLLCTPVLQTRKFLESVVEGLGGHLASNIRVVFRDDLLAAAANNPGLHGMWARREEARATENFTAERLAEEQLVMGALRATVRESTATELVLCGIPQTAGEARDLIEVLGLPQCALLLTMNPRAAVKRAQAAITSAEESTKLAEEIADFEHSWNEVSRFVSNNNLCGLKIYDLGRQSVTNVLSECRATLVKSLVPAGEAGSSSLRRISGRRVRNN